eukprot:775172_1
MSVILRNFFWAIGTANNLLKMSSDENKKKEANKKRDSIMRQYSLTLSNSRTSLLQMEQQLFTIDMDANLDVIEDEIEDENKKENINEENDEISDGKYVNELTINTQCEQQLFTIDMDANLDVIEDEIEDENKKENINEENDEISDGKYVNELTINTQCEQQLFTI